MADFGGPGPDPDYRAAHETLDVLIGLYEATAFKRVHVAASAIRIPVVVVAGFLGAGKTTLMRHVLSAQSGLRIAAVVNDLASLSVDAELIREVSADTTELVNGCICCSVSGSMAKTLQSIAQRPSKPDIILVECSGATDPWSLAHVIDSINEVTLDSVVAIADATQFSDGKLFSPFQARQIRAADIVLLNKIDLVPDETADAAARAILQIVPKAQILRTRDCAVPPCVILDSSHKSLRNGAASDGSEGESFASFVVGTEHAVDRAALERCIAALPAGVLRVKGFVQLKDETGSVEVLQSVGRRWRWHPASVHVRSTRLAVIGLADCLSQDLIAQHFAPAGLQVLDDHDHDRQPASQDLLLTARGQRI